jgi:hypothetical protein
MLPHQSTTCGTRSQVQLQFYIEAIKRTGDEDYHILMVAPVQVVYERIQQVLMQCTPNYTLREACFICDSTSVPTNGLSGTASNASSSFYTLHPPQAMSAHGMNVPISLTLCSTT